jgi:hypothetical protein
LARPKKKQTRKSGYRDSARMVRMLDDLAAHEEFKSTILPVLQAEVANGTPAEELAARFQTHAVARLITIISTETDSGKSLAAVKELLDRVQGKPVQKSEQTHKFEKLKDEQLDALLQSKLSDLRDDDEDQIN